mgnify:CR=1 FL=1
MPLKITPAHDPNDFEVGKRHDLPEINILNDDATINKNGGKYEGMDRYEARKAIVADLEEQGYLVKIKEHEHNVGTHDRCGTTVEPMINGHSVCEDGRTRKTSDRSCEERRSEIRTRTLYKDISSLVREHP